MRDPLRERAERVALRSKLNSETGSERRPAYPPESPCVARSGETGRRVVESSLASAEPHGQHALRSTANSRAVNSRPEGTARTSEFYPAHVLHPRLVHDEHRGSAKKPLRVMKFGGTSVGDASCIEKFDFVDRVPLNSSVTI